MCLERGRRSMMGLPHLMEYPNGGILAPRSMYLFAEVWFAQPVSIGALSLSVLTQCSKAGPSGLEVALSLVRQGLTFRIIGICSSRSLISRCH